MVCVQNAHHVLNMLLTAETEAAISASALQSCGLDMADMEAAEEGPVPLDDGPVDDEVFEDMDGDDVGFCFDLCFFPQIHH